MLKFMFLIPFGIAIAIVRFAIILIKEEYQSIKERIEIKRMLKKYS